MLRLALTSLLLGLCCGLAGPLTAAESAQTTQGYFSRDGNGGTPSQTAGNNMYIKFYDDRWLGLMFVPYPYAVEVDSATIDRVFDRARAQVSSAALLKGTYGLLEQAATLQIEPYGHVGDRIIFECGSMSPCTIRLAPAYLELIKPGVINEHIIRYYHVAKP